MDLRTFLAAGDVVAAAFDELAAARSPAVDCRGAATMLLRPRPPVLGGILTCLALGRAIGRLGCSRREGRKRGSFVELLRAGRVTDALRLNGVEVVRQLVVLRRPEALNELSSGRDRLAQSRNKLQGENRGGAFVRDEIACERGTHPGGRTDYEVMESPAIRILVRTRARRVFAASKRAGATRDICAGE